MEFRHLRYFVQIVDSQSLSGASRVLGVAQPALSQQIAQLEAQLGLMLLTRSVRGVQATKSGEAFYNQAKSLLRQLADIPTIIAAADEEEAGTVSIGLPASIASVIGDSLIVRLGCRLKLANSRAAISRSSLRLRDSSSPCSSPTRSHAA
jgi:LysR family transcriptional regulator, nitrogen assimilation regulatory protein